MVEWRGASVTAVAKVRRQRRAHDATEEQEPEQEVSIEGVGKCIATSVAGRREAAAAGEPGEKPRTVPLLQSAASRWHPCTHCTTFSTGAQWGQ